MRDPHWDGGPELTSPLKPSKQAYGAYLASKQRKVDMNNAKVYEDIQRPDASSSDDDLHNSNNRGLSRQEMKQLDRELPWREIWAMPQMIKDKFIESAVNEYKGWLEWSSIKPLSAEEAAAVRSDRKLSRRILKSRAAYRDKNKGTGEVKAKTRVVLVGCADPDLKSLLRDSPTPTRLSEFLIISIASAGANRSFNGDGKLWRMWLSDAEKAFLQGDQDTPERKGLPLYMQPPRDPIILAAEAYPADLYLVTSNCYGLANAPRAWFKKVDRRARERDFIQHSFDRCLYYHVGPDKQLDAVMIIHVDDFMAVYSETFDLTILQDMFQWGNIVMVSPDTPGEYRGKEITMFEEAGKMHYKVSQKAFTQGLKPGKLGKGRLQRDLTLTEDERRDFRSICGSLQWLSGQTRPDLCAPVSLSHRGQETDVTDLKFLLECVDYARETADSGIVFPAVALDRATTVVAYSDASWANARLSKSQYGAIVTLCPAQVTEVTCYAYLVDWKSGRTPRVCRSTLASEACACDEAADRACFVNLVLSEILFQKPAHHGDMRLNSLICTDARSLYDCLVSENPSLTDKRSMVQVRSIQQSFSPEAVRWVPTHLQFSDGLTKADQMLREVLRKWCQKPWVQIKDDSAKTKTSVNFVNFLSAWLNQT